MGYGMASNIRKGWPSSSTLYIVDPNVEMFKKFVHEFSSHGPIVIASSAREAASKTQTLMSMVPNPADARKVHLDRENGTIAAPADGKRLVLDSSTVDPATTREIGQTLMTNGANVYVDTPVAVSAGNIYEWRQERELTSVGRRDPCRHWRTDLHDRPRKAHRCQQGSDRPHASSGIIDGHPQQDPFLR